jgi:ABC-type uncharacterized transport system substrate-binding protein
MKRRQFIALLGGTALTWPLAAQAQQTTVPVVGFLRSTRADGLSYLVDGLQAGLAETGHMVGRNVVLEQRWAGEQLDRLPALATEMIRSPAAVIVANTLPPRRPSPTGWSTRRSRTGGW